AACYYRDTNPILAAIGRHSVAEVLTDYQRTATLPPPPPGRTRSRAASQPMLTTRSLRVHPGSFELPRSGAPAWVRVISSRCAACRVVLAARSSALRHYSG